jgi:diguanylate cyclase
VQLRISSWKHVFVGSAVVTAIVATIPVVVLAIAFGAVPMFIKFPFLLVSGLIPLLIAIPLSILSLHMLKRLNQTVAHLDAYVKVDHLTGVLTRGYFMSEVEKVRAEGGCLIMADADHFKRINDTHGHDAGDEVLRVIGRLINRVIGNGNFAGRLGGEEFAIYLPQADLAQADMFAAALGSAIRNQRLAGFDSVGFTVSMGVAVDTPRRSLSEVLKIADQCLYAAKTSGRDRHFLEQILHQPSVAAA